MQINIFQGSETPSIPATITIVIDVIRAFTVSNVAFLGGANRIFLADSVQQAIKIKQENPDFLLAGEVNGLAVKGFDLDNSPFRIQKEFLVGKTLVQKTTNGVKATLNCLASEHLYVTGFTNARKTAEYVRDSLNNNKQMTVNIIASHPSGDDDLACAEYIKSILEGSNSILADEVINRIKCSHVAEKFFNEENIGFMREDIFTCIKEFDSGFVMKVSQKNRLPMIERVNI
ncbi:2-phosphosulfolactate phosphatase [Virgibacillus sp. DJP39]|uniref:2-phosphosulfolactate phosphatase n=1 Tax=Virgibacillus sp. DJP39 TaxID=3409790 RepID=UPI003BB5E82D